MHRQVIQTTKLVVGVTQERVNSNNEARGGSTARGGSDYYSLLGVSSTASAQEIRRAYRERSKLYHPDTTTLPPAIAVTKFQQLNEAYATLNSPERRITYNQKLGLTSQGLPRLHLPNKPPPVPSPPRPRVIQSSGFLDPTDRPLSPGEVFALFILGLTFIGCLVLAIAIGITRGEITLQPVSVASPVPVEQRQEVTPAVELPVELPAVLAAPTVEKAVEAVPVVLPAPAIPSEAPIAAPSEALSLPTASEALVAAPSEALFLPTASEALVAAPSEALSLPTASEVSVAVPSGSVLAHDQTALTVDAALPIAAPSPDFAH